MIMNKLFLGLMSFVFSVGLSFGQNLSQHEVPSVIVNRFQQEFPKAKDIDWERKGDYYEVEFEMDWPSKDHELWYDVDGNIIRHKQEISKSDLPKAISLILKKDYKWHWIKDVKKIQNKNEITYLVEVKSISEEWDLIFDETGKVLQKVRD